MTGINLRSQAAGLAAGLALTVSFAVGGCGKANEASVSAAEQSNWKGGPMPADFAAKLAVKEKAATAIANEAKQAVKRQAAEAQAK